MLGFTGFTFVDLQYMFYKHKVILYVWFGSRNSQWSRDIVFAIDPSLIKKMLYSLQQQQLKMIICTIIPLLTLTKIPLFPKTILYSV